ncbi:plasmid partitioning protein RepA [Ruegeria sp. HKCCD8929]|uniref:plasmid partitioning protein RepA n=1 Tax=Ruegeria sp. HKCCD8929 TaxID=2683006 RepID=UPI0014880415|nr:plasmid partitioning protein RepA [Ruegeria sp. HKCCD8929]
MIPTTPIASTSPVDISSEISSRLNLAIKEHLLAAYAPDSTKQLRLFPAQEVCDLIGISHQYLRKATVEGAIPEASEIKHGRRYYTGQEVWELRQLLDARSKTPGRYLPSRREGEPLQRIQVMNFKGGSSKSTTCIHLAHYLALQGFRVLCVDLDPQASLSAMCGLQTELDESIDTVYDAITYHDPISMKEVIRETYFPGLSIAPGGLMLSEFEAESAKLNSKQHPFFARLHDAIMSVEADYDVVLIDSPPSLGFITMGGMAAATSVIVPLTPSMLDVASTAQFLKMTSSYMEVIERSGAKLVYDNYRLLVTRDEPVDTPSQTIVAFMRALFQERVMTATSLKSTAISDAAMLQQSIYELNRSDLTRATYDRAKASMDAVGKEVENMVLEAWGRI